MTPKYWILGLLLLSISAAAAPLTLEQKACTFKKPVVIGASITANAALSIPGYSLLVRALALRKGIFSLGDFGASPHRFLLMGYARNGFFSSGEANYSVKFTNKNEHWGSSQVMTLLEGPDRKVFRNASVVIGIDAFYWDAIAGNCGNYRQSAEHAIRRITQEAREKNVKLILGNVPHEDPEKVIIDSEAVGIPGLWYRPEDLCVDSINETLGQLCLAENGCYLIDLNTMAQRLNAGGRLALKDGSLHGLYSMRPDGVHLSASGSIYVRDMIVDALEAHPPQCR